MVTDQFFSPPSLERQTGCFGSDLGEGGILPEVTDAAHPAPKVLNFFEKKSWQPSVFGPFLARVAGGPTPLPP